MTPTAKTLTYTYDDLNRLLSADSSGLAAGDYSLSYQYDEVGNMTYKSDVGTMLYEGTGTAGTGSGGTGGSPIPHAVTSVDGLSRSYDNNGNLLDDGESTYNWNIRNKLDSSGDMSYTYDHSGSRVKSVNAATGEETVYINQYMELRDGQPVYYIFAGGTRVASLEDDNSGTGTLEITYLHQDHLGGTALATDETGLVVQLYDYYPFGTQLEDASYGDSEVEVNHSFTDKEFEEELGLYYFEARWMDSRIGQFVNVDPMDGISYIYAAGNPIRMIDPLGLYNMESGEVESGDTMSSITNELNDFYGTSSNYNDIAQINGISDPDNIQAGQIIRMGSIDADGNIWLVPNDPNSVDTDCWGSLTTFQQKILHYSRNFYQGNVPSTQSEAEAAGWANYGEAIAHNLNGASGNVDFRGPNGEQAIYDTNGNLVTSPENMGTYDYEQPGSWYNFSQNMNHKALDVTPWLQWGNSTSDTTTMEERGNSSILY